MQQSSAPGRTSRLITNFLLTLFTAAIIGAAKELNEVHTEMAALKAMINVRMYELSEVKKKQEDHSLQMADLFIRITKLELFNDEKKYRK